MASSKKRKRTSKKQAVALPSWEERGPAVRTYVLVHVYVGASDGFDISLSRVPGLGEEINVEDRSYKVTRVQHEPVDEYGRARLGWHAFVDADLLPPED